MSVIKCPTCNGTGKVEIKRPLTKEYLYGCRVGDNAPLMVEEIINCPNCGGSGCKWKEESEE